MQRALGRLSQRAASRQDRCRPRPGASASRRPRGTSARPSPRVSRARHRARRRSGAKRVSCKATNGLSRGHGPAILAHLLGQRRDRRHQRIGVGEQLVLQPQRMHLRIHSASGGADHGAHQRLHEGAIEREIDLGDARRVAKRRSSAASLPPSARMSSSVRASQRITQSPVTRSGLAVSSRLRLEHRLVEAGRQHVDQIDIAGELAVLLARDAAGDEDAEMTDGLVDRVDDRLAVGADLVDVVVEIENPAERLLRRRDVVALRAEHDDRRADVAQVDRACRPRS